MIGGLQEFAFSAVTVGSWQLVLGHGAPKHHQHSTFFALHPCRRHAYSKNSNILQMLGSLLADQLSRIFCLFLFSVSQQIFKLAGY
jgi:hypothetical protein